MGCEKLEGQGPVKVKDSRSENRKGGGDGDGVQPGVGLCVALAVAVDAAPDGIEFEVEIEVEAVMWCSVGWRWWCASVCLALALVCSALICVARQGCTRCRRHAVVYLRYYVHGLALCPQAAVDSPQFSTQQSTGYGSNCQDVRATQGAVTWGAGAQVESGPTLHEGEAREVLGSGPEEASTLKPGGGPLCPGLPDTSAGQAPSCFSSSQCLSSEIF